MSGLVKKSLNSPEETRPFQDGTGRLELVNLDGGEEKEFGPGDFMICPPGHDAWIVGDEPCVLIDWQGFADYAKP